MGGSGDPLILEALEVLLAPREVLEVPQAPHQAATNHLGPPHYRLMSSGIRDDNKEPELI
jgi:hypothetical protein